MKTLEISFVLCFTTFIFKSAVTVEWPNGTYTLVKPKSGCPPGWIEGWRYQDNEDQKNMNRLSYGHHFYGTFGINMKFFYCTKYSNESSGYRNWPPGNYCILKHGESCPTGFETGRVNWDDEDSNNKNEHGGVLPSGLVGRNTTIDYCCREDGPYYSSHFELPTTHPFYLLRFTSPCQLVKGMYVREESVYFDDEDDDNTNSVSGKYPMGASNGNNQQLLYCYYSRLGSE